MKILISAALVVSLATMGQAVAQTPDQARDTSQTQQIPETPSYAPPKADANAPKAPALAEEPHGSGTVYQELQSEKTKTPDQR